MNLISQNKLSPEEIIYFIKHQDYYYYSESFINDDKRNPFIFNFIPITDKDKNYLKNIELLKNNQIWSFYSNSNENMKKKLYKAMVSQIEKITDLKSLFDIFQIIHLK